MEVGRGWTKRGREQDTKTRTINEITTQKGDNNVENRERKQINMDIQLRKHFPMCMQSRERGGGIEIEERSGKEEK